MPPYSPFQFPAGDEHDIDRNGLSEELNRLHEAGVTPPALGILLDTLATEKEKQRQQRIPVDMVWTGQEAQGLHNRSTFVVVEELFRKVKKELLLSFYNIWDGKDLFKLIGQRLDAGDDLDIRIFLNIDRKRGDTTLTSDLLRHFASEFRKRHWKWDRLPRIFYDPRALSMNPDDKAVLHAKCVVIDRQEALVTSANFTEAAHRRNVELGLLVRNPFLADQIVQHFDLLAEVGRFHELKLG